VIGGAIEQFKAISACPRCHSRLTWSAERITCAECRAAYGFEHGRPKFHDQELTSTADAAFQREQMFNESLTAKLFNLGKKFVNSRYRQRDHIAEALAETPAGSIVVELGSGDRRLRDDVIDVDLLPFPNVDVLADVARTPFAGDSAPLVVMDRLIEHVPEPHRVVEEARRMLKPGGRAVCLTPFVFPYHGYPNHYCNFTSDGLQVLFGRYSSCEVDTNIGPTSALTNLISEYVAVAASRGHPLLYTAAKGMTLLPLLPFKYLDRLWSRSGPATRLASLLGAVAVK